MGSSSACVNGDSIAASPIRHGGGPAGGNMSPALESSAQGGGEVEAAVSPQQAFKDAVSLSKDS